MARPKTSNSKSKERRGAKGFIADEVALYEDAKPKARQLKDITYRTKFKNKKQKDVFNLILDNRIIFIGGPAGTGKTLITLMAAIEALTSDRHNIGKISLTKPIIEAARSIGFLKGDLKEKTEQYFVSFYDNLEKIIGKSDTKLLRENELITETIINFIRGNTFGSQNALGEPIGHFCVLDEAQNLTVSELKTYISRLGNEDSKMVILGDEDQQDIKLKDGELNGLQWAFEYLTDIPGVAHFRFDEDDIVRSQILTDILKRFKRFENF